MVDSKYYKFRYEKYHAHRSTEYAISRENGLVKNIQNQQRKPESKEGKRKNKQLKIVLTHCSLFRLTI